MGQENEKRGNERGGERMESKKVERNRQKPEMAVYDFNESDNSGFLNVCKDHRLYLLKPIRLNQLCTAFIAHEGHPDHNVLN